MQLHPAYPSEQHAAAASAVVDFWRGSFAAEAILLVNSCARGKATRDSCLDIVVLARPEILNNQLTTWEAAWANFEATDPAIEALRSVGQYSVVHLDFTDGVFEPTEQDEAAGPDAFELAVGNFIAYSVPLWEGGDYLAELKTAWLPYYDEALRHARLEMVRFYCLNNLHHIPLYLTRGLYFQAFDRLYNAYQEFLQALFIARRVYPIAYNKWIQEQIVDILALPDLYEELIHLFEIERFASNELLAKAQQVEALLDRYAPRADGA